MINHHFHINTFSPIDFFSSEMSFLHLSLGTVLLISSCLTFDAGFRELASSRSSNKDRTHYSMTICALCRVTIDYLKTYYKINTDYLESRFDETNAECQFDIINLLQSSSKYTANPYEFSHTIDRIASANTKTDLKEMLEDDTHFDSESFIEGSQLILKRYQATIQQQRDNFDQARKTFGEMLHTLQDFYSHTNYIEIGSNSPSDVLAKRIFQSNEFADISTRTCVNCDKNDCQTKSNLDSNFEKTKLLTSGYFIPIGLNLLQRKKPSGKCSHGGTFDSTSDDEPTGGINKDNFKASHGHLHARAASMAYQATVNVLNQLRNQIGDEDFGQFLTLKPRLNSLVICIDTTYSTVNFFDLAKNISKTIINQYQSFKYGPYNYILIQFDSTQAKLLLNTRNPNDLIQTIENLQLKLVPKSLVGEMYFHSLIEALKICEYASIIYTFTDSFASDENMKFQVRALVRNKATVIYSFIELSQQFENDLPWITGGLTIPIIDGDQSMISEFILHRFQWTNFQSLFISKCNSSTSIDFYVDSWIDTLFIDILSTSNNQSQFQLQSPNNSFYQLNKTKSLLNWKITKPISGRWRLTITFSSPLDIQIHANTNLSCSSILQIPTETNGFTQLTTEPIQNSNLSVQTTCENLQYSHLNISLIDEFGRILSIYSANQIDSYGSLTQIQIPREKFRIQTTIQLANGNYLQRIEKQLFSPTIYSIELINRPRIVQPGQTVQLTSIIQSSQSGFHHLRFQIIDTQDFLIETDLNFTNQTVQIQTMTFTSNLTINLITFSVSRFDNRTGNYVVENDETASIYLDIDSSTQTFPISNKLVLFIIVFLFFKT